MFATLKLYKTWQQVVINLCPLWTNAATHTRHSQTVWNLTTGCSLCPFWTSLATHVHAILTLRLWKSWQQVVPAVLTWLVPHETAAVLARSVYTIQPCTMSLHAKPHTESVCVFYGYIKRKSNWWSKLAWKRQNCATVSTCRLVWFFCHFVVFVLVLLLLLLC